MMRALPQTLPNLPRYTSYPTAPHFSTGAAAAASRKLREEITPERDVSVYIHIPYCDRLCWFCGCHTKHTLKYEPVERYVEVLVQEISGYTGNLGFKPRISALHLGGGSPSMLKAQEARKIRQALDAAFSFCDDAEISVEIDPNDAHEEMLEAMSLIGMNRCSLGVQDFDPVVQAAINRPQGYEETARVVEDLRALGVRSLNIDALYGLPHQTVATIRKTAAQIVSLDPDRIALFGYAHVPSIKKHQRLIDDTALPGDRERMQQSSAAKERFLQAGYEAIGIDHFAKPGDALALARREKRLRRNFQGYTTDGAMVLIGFGASAISSSPGSIVQNTVATNLYMQRASQGETVAERGVMLSRDDRIRNYMIQSLMCNFELDYMDLQAQFGRSADAYVREARQVAADEADRLVAIHENSFSMLPERRELVRLVAARFDSYLNAAQGLYSKAV